MAQKKTNAQMLEEVNTKLDKLLTDKEKGSGKSAAKKPAAKKPAEKKTADKKPAEKKPAAKKPAAKKPVEKEEEVKKEKEPVTQVVVDAPVTQHEEPVAEEPVEPVEEPVAEEPAEAPVEEPVTEEPAEEPVKEEVKQEPVKEAAAAEDKKSEPAPVYYGKAHTFINNKGKLPIFIIINALFIVSAILLMFASFAYGPEGDVKTTNIFSYYANGDEIKLALALSAGGWAKGSYVMLGILMFFAMLVPLGLAVKNIVIYVKKKDASVYAFDAIIYYAVMLGFVTMVNLFGAIVAAGQVISLIFAIAILAFTIFTLLLTRGRGAFPIYSIVNLVVTFICLFLLTYYVYNYTLGDQTYSLTPAFAADGASGGGFMWFMLFVTSCALILNVILQLKHFPGKIGAIIDMVVPIAAGVCALIALIAAGAGKPDDVAAAKLTYSMNGGFVFGAILTMLLAVADALFTFLKPLQKYKKTIAGGEVAPAAAAAATSSDSDSASAAAAATFCPSCGAKNEAGAGFCAECGEKLN